MTPSRTTRRGLAATLSGLAAAACAPRVLVNLADPNPPGAVPVGEDVLLRMTAPVRINGQGPFSFVVDTGANSTVVAADIAAALGLPDAGPAQVHGVAGVEGTATARVAQLALAGHSMRDLRVPVMPRANLGADGLLGVDMLRGNRVLLDFRRGELLIGGAGGYSAAGLGAETEGRTRADLGPRVAVPARYRFGQLIIVGADVAGRKVTAFLDSGSQSTVGNSPLRRISLGDAANPAAVRQRTPVFSATGQIAEGEVAQMPLLRIGGLSIARLSTVFADLHVFRIWDLQTTPSLLIGMDVLRRFNAVELNYPRREVVFYLRPEG